MPARREPDISQESTSGGCLRQNGFEAFGRLALVDLLDGGQFAGESLQGGLIDLTLAIGLVGLITAAI